MGSVCGAAAPAIGPGGMMDSSSVAPHAYGADGLAGRQSRRRRPRHRRREDSGRSDSSPAAAPAPDVAPALTTMQDQAPEMPPPCIISWSDQVVHAEEDLGLVRLAGQPTHEITVHVKSVSRQNSIFLSQQSAGIVF